MFGLILFDILNFDNTVIGEPAWDGCWGRGYGDLEDERSGVVKHCRS